MLDRNGHATSERQKQANCNTEWLKLYIARVWINDKIKIFSGVQNKN